MGHPPTPGILVRMIVDRYAKGESVPAIAADLGVGSTTIYRIAREHGLPPRGKTEGGVIRRRFTDEQEQAIAARYANGETSRQIGNDVGMSIAAIRQVVRRHGGKIRNRGGLERIFTQKSLDEIANLYNNGESQEKIAKRLSISQSTVSRALREAGVTPWQAMGGRPDYGQGQEHSRWKGGRVVGTEGYVRLWIEADDSLGMAMRDRTGYCMEHRLVMARSLGRPLENHESVHHINGIKDDNRLENLQLRQGKHGRGVIQQCGDCGSSNIIYLEL